MLPAGKKVDFNIQSFPSADIVKIVVFYLLSDLRFKEQAKQNRTLELSLTLRGSGSSTLGILF